MPAALQRAKARPIADHVSGFIRYMAINLVTAKALRPMLLRATYVAFWQILLQKPVDGFCER
jgi:hypothetical protein